MIERDKDWKKTLLLMRLHRNPQTWGELQKFTGFSKGLLSKYLKEIPGIQKTIEDDKIKYVHKSRITGVTAERAAAAITNSVNAYNLLLNMKKERILGHEITTKKICDFLLKNKNRYQDRDMLNETELKKGNLSPVALEIFLEPLLDMLDNDSNVFCSFKINARFDDFFIEKGKRIEFLRKKISESTKEGLKITEKAK